MMDLKPYRSKLVGTDEERAVSPVIGVILMVAITVILAAVIAAFVLDMGDSIDQEAQSGASMSFDVDSEDLSVELTSEGNADTWELRGDYYVGDSDSGVDPEPVGEGDYKELEGAGDTLTMSCMETSDFDDLGDDEYALGEDGSDSGTVTLAASNDGGDSWTTIGSESFECTS